MVIHPVQVPRWLPQSISLLKLSPRPMNKSIFYPVIKRLYPLRYLKELVAPTEIQYFQHGLRSWTNYTTWSTDSVIRVPRYVISGFSSNTLRLSLLP